MACMFRGPQMMEAMAKKVKACDVEVVGHTMATDLLTDEGKSGKCVIGAVGFNVKNGEFKVFKAKATILAAGGCGFKARFAGHKFQTGEACAMAYRAGAELGRFELARSNRSGARKLLRRSLKRALEQKRHAAAVSAYLALVAAHSKPPDNSRRLVMGRRFARLKKYGHALGIMGGAFKPEAEIEGLDLLLYEIAELFAGPLKDSGRAAAAYSLLRELFPQSPRSLDAEYQLRKLHAAGKA